MNPKNQILVVFACELCTHVQKETDTGLYECRHHAPILVQDAEIPLRIFPQVYPDDWCSDFEEEKK